MYNTNDLDYSKYNERKLLALIIFINTLFIICIIVSFVFRIKILSMLLTIIDLSATLFVTSVYYLPTKKYSDFISAILKHMKNNEKTLFGTVKAISDNSIIYDGIECYSITIKTGEDINGDVEAVLYIDSQKSLKNISISDKLCFVLFDRYIIDIK